MVIGKTRQGFAIDVADDRARLLESNREVTCGLAVATHRKGIVAHAGQVSGELINQRPQWPGVKAPALGSVVEFIKSILLDAICIEGDRSYASGMARKTAAMLAAALELRIIEHSA